jgi:hypothetical protein
MGLHAENNKKPGVLYAVTNDGLELPVIDITHPAFALSEGPEDLPRIAEASLRALRRSRRMPGFVKRLMARRSILLRGAMAPSGGFQTGLVTYLFKLGSDNLGRGYAGTLDRRMCRSIAAISMRMRLRSMARLAADALAVTMAERPGRPVRVVNIAGGTAIDSINACILLCREKPDLVPGRQIQLWVLDLDEGGPSFGARALAALRRDGAPLAGLDASLIRHAYDWSDVSSLRRITAGLDADDVVACLSEGGLFEYASDAAVVANMEVLRDATPADCPVIGSAIRDQELTRVMLRTSSMSFKIRPRDTMAALAARGGWAIERAEDGNPMYEILRLRKR